MRGSFSRSLCWRSAGAVVGQDRKGRTRVSLEVVPCSRQKCVAWDGGGCVPLGHTSPTPLCGLHHPGQAEVAPVWAMISGTHQKW